MINEVETFFKVAIKNKNRKLLYIINMLLHLHMYPLIIGTNINYLMIKFDLYLKSLLLNICAALRK